MNWPGGIGGPRRKTEDVNSFRDHDPIFGVSPEVSHHHWKSTSPTQTHDGNASITNYVHADLISSHMYANKDAGTLPLTMSVDPYLVTALESSKDSSTIAQTKSMDTLETPVEWTPPDSSYGAAFPWCGCIPKNTRRYIEVGLLTLGAFVIIYLVIQASVIISGGLKKNGSPDISGSKYLETDDDFYVVSTNDGGYDDFFFYTR